jgi:hypothetical protein
MTFRSSLKGHIVFFVGLILAINPLVAQAVAPEDKPIVQILSPRYDAGTRWEGEIVTHVFEVKNAGSSELRIINVKPG